VLNLQTELSERGYNGLIEPNGPGRVECGVADGSYLDDLFDLLAFHGGGEAVAVMKVWGYFDAGGTHSSLDRSGKPSPAVCVAGYLATPLQWKQFDKAWREVLMDAGVPYFHANEFVARRSPFDGWSEEKRLKFTLDLIGVISGNVTYGIGMCVMRAEYEAVLANVPLVKQVFGEPYTFCCHLCFMTGADWARRLNYKESIKYIFESGDSSGEILAVYNKASRDERVRERFRFGIGGLTFEDGVKVTPLQAADFLTYELYREMGRHVQPNPGQVYTRNSLTALLEITGDYRMYGQDEVIGFLYDWGYLRGASQEDEVRFAEASARAHQTVERTKQPKSV
jgi:hypothetical protein